MRVYCALLHTADACYNRPQFSVAENPQELFDKVLYLAMGQWDYHGGATTMEELVLWVQEECEVDGASIHVYEQETDAEM